LRRGIEKRPVLWSEAALDDFNANIAYIAKRDPSFARKVGAAINEVVNGLGIAATGRRGRVAGTYEKSVSNFPYVIAYALDALRERVVILHIIHTSRNWPKAQWPK
jgi:plasmid stabilization system protein ParE